LKILIIVPSYKPAYIYGGPIRSIANLCEALNAHGMDVTVFTTTANGKEELNVRRDEVMMIDGVKVIYFKRQTKGHSHLSLDLFKRLNRDISDFDVVHIHSWWNLVAVIAAWLVLRKGKRPIISPRGTMTSFSFTHRNKKVKSLFHWVIGRKLLSKSTLHVTSDEEERKLKQFVKTDKIFCIPNLQELPEISLSEPRKSSGMNLLFVGRIHPVKNLEFLLEIVKTIDNIPLSLTIIGEGDEKYVARLKEIVRGRSNILWLGSKDGDEKFKLMAQSDLLLLPSHIENFGNVVLESLSQGTPVLISDQVGLKDYVLTHQLGWVVPNTKSLWIDTLNNIWTNQLLNQQLRDKAVASVKRDFNSSSQVQRYIDMYQKHKITMN